MKFPIRRINADSVEILDDFVIREFPLTLVVNGQELVTLLCSPADLKYLAVGFLLAEGLISSKEDIKKLLVDDIRGIIRVEVSAGIAHSDEIFKRFISSGCGRGTSFYSAADAGTISRVESDLVITSSAVTSLFREFQHRSQLFQKTGGVHSAAICNTEKILVFAEDIGRHNAVDKIFGRCLLDGLPTADKLILTSGRISSEVLLKVARRNVPVLASKSAPTDLGVRLATDLGITLLGFVRGGRMNVYAHEGRIQNGR